MSTAPAAVRRALAGELAPMPDCVGPYEFEVELRKPAGAAMRQNLAQLEGFTLLQDDLVAVTAPDMDLGLRRVAYLGYADRPGVTRH